MNTHHQTSVTTACCDRLKTLHSRMETILSQIQELNDRISALRQEQVVLQGKIHTTETMILDESLQSANVLDTLDDD